MLTQTTRRQLVTCSASLHHSGFVINPLHTNRLQLPSRLVPQYARHINTRTSRPDSTSHLPLSNLRILDLTRVLAGPFCTQILADYGATVLKIEQPGSGDETRQWRTVGETGQMWDDDYLVKSNGGQSSGPLMSLYFAAVNRNKRSMTLNLKSERGRQLIKDMLAPGPKGYDVIIHNFLPGKMDSLGLGYEILKSLNPGLIYASVSGYGADGPSSRRAGYDAIALAEAGLLHITGSQECGPAKPGVAIADLSSGLYMHGAILAAVNARTQSGRGCSIDASLFESSLSLLINVGLASLNLDLDGNRRRGSRLGLGHPNLVPYGAYKTKDGRKFFIAANNNRQWQSFGRKIGLEDGFVNEYGTNDKRVESRSRIDTVLGEKFGEKTLEDWTKVFEGSGLPYGPINDVVEALEHSQADARNMVVPLEGVRAARDSVVRLIGPAVKFDGGRESFQVRRQPPLLGEHTEEVLRDLNISDGRIAELKADGVV